MTHRHGALTFLPVAPLRSVGHHAPAMLQAIHGLRTSSRTVMVHFRYSIWEVNRQGARVKSGRSTSIILDIPSEVNSSAEDGWIKDTIRSMLLDNFENLHANADSNQNALLWLDDSQQPDFTVDGLATDLDRQLVLQHVGSQSDTVPTPSGVRMYGYLKDNHLPQHRAFRYMIHGCDMQTLQHLVPEDHCHSHNECDRMCAYRMLEDRNITQEGRVPKKFQAKQVNQWLNAHGFAVGGLTDGLSSDDIQAHAMEFKYGHCAMDLKQSVLNLYIPDKRDHHLKTMCYVVVGDHCQPIVDANVVKSIMDNASARIGKRNWCNLAGMICQSKTKEANAQIQAEDRGRQQQQNRKKRHRSLDRIFKPAFDRSEDSQQQAQCQDITDITVEDWEETFSDSGDTDIPDSYFRKKNKYQVPLVTDVDRIHLYTLADNMDLVEEKCKPTYQEGPDASLLHYYICTDQDDVEFLYDYLVRVLKIDPLRFARSFHRKCRSIQMGNTVWKAHTQIHLLMKLHAVLQPKEPFKVVGLATYGFHMLSQELFKQTRKAGTIFECMSHYPPNLQRLMDTQHPFNRPKIGMATFHPPYSNPKDSPVVRTLIPSSQRVRIDLIRSYASTIKALTQDENDQYPIHDPTNVVIAYDEEIHGHLPVGHYLVALPTPDELRAHPEWYGTLDDWRKMPCLTLGQSRMMSHRMVKALLHRHMITKTCIRLIAATDPHRQKKYGMVLVQALKTVLETIYKHPELQELAPKHLINHLIGFCQGTSVPHSGMRYVFHDLKHLYYLISTMAPEDPLQRMKILHVHGHDPLWHTPYDYYELNGSGLTYKSFHFQPIFNMVLEDQALRVFDLARPIPLAQLIQINVDAIEYRVTEPRLPPDWAQSLAQDTVPIEIYDKLSPQEMYDDYLGRFRREIPKPEEKAHLYYHENHAHESTKTHRFLDGSTTTIPAHQEPLRDTETQDPCCPRWSDQLRILREEDHPNGWNQLWTDLCTSESDASGLLLTGAAGTGKTYLLKSLAQFGLNLQRQVTMTAFTHAACVQMGPNAVTLSALFGCEEKVDLRAGLACSARFGAHLRSLNIDLLIVDEISMIPFSLLECLYVFHRISPKTRIVCVGDFHQLPPVEPHLPDRPEDYNYFDATDMFPYLLYDRVLNVPGRWIPLTQCKRTTDPLLMRICLNPADVTTITAAEFPMPSRGIPIWRFLSWRNSTRKACNWYCMHRYLETYPTKTAHRFPLRDLWVQRKFEEQQKKSPLPLPDSARVALVKQFETQYKPNHYRYLQNFVYAEDMEVVCRNTLKQWDQQGGGISTEDSLRPAVVNNRRAILRIIDTEKNNVTIRWCDILQRFQDNHHQQDCIEDHDITLTFYDFAWNFVPGFCITAHMAQGETIREHYGLLEWQEVSKMPKMAYVSVTRGASSQLLHIVPPYSDPWDVSSDTSRVRDNVLHKMYQSFRRDKNQTYDLDLEDVTQRLLAHPVCTLCSVPLVLTYYSYKVKEQFALLHKQDSLSPTDCHIVCENCRWPVKK